MLCSQLVADQQRLQHLMSAYDVIVDIDDDVDDDIVKVFGLLGVILWFLPPHGRHTALTG